MPTSTLSKYLTNNGRKSGTMEGDSVKPDSIPAEVVQRSTDSESLVSKESSLPDVNQNQTPVEIETVNEVIVPEESPITSGDCGIQDSQDFSISNITHTHEVSAEVKSKGLNVDTAPQTDTRPPDEVQNSQDNNSPTSDSRNDEASIQANINPSSPDPDPVQEIRLRPSEIRFSQNNISAMFCGGIPLVTTFRSLVEGNLDVEHLPLIQCVERNGRWFVTNGNRRLFLYKKLEEARIVRSIPVLNNGTFSVGRFTTKNDGKDIYCREGDIDGTIAKILSEHRQNQDAKFRALRQKWRRYQPY